MNAIMEFSVKRIFGEKNSSTLSTLELSHLSLTCVFHYWITFSFSNCLLSANAFYELWYLSIHLFDSISARIYFARNRSSPAILSQSSNRQFQAEWRTWFRCIFLSLHLVAFAYCIRTWRNHIFRQWNECSTVATVRCDWDNVPHLQTLRGFCAGFSIVGGIVIYVVAAVFILINFALRIHYYGTKDGSCIRTFFNLLKSHLFIFVPPIAYGFCQIPFSITASTKNQKDSYYQCGISFGEFFIQILMGLLTSLPYALTWLLFVFTSRVYMTDYYLSTWSGRGFATIIIFLKSYNCSKKNVVLPYTNPTGNEHNNPVFSCEHE